MRVTSRQNGGKNKGFWLKEEHVLRCGGETSMTPGEAMNVDQIVTS